MNFTDALEWMRERPGRECEDSPREDGGRMRIRFHPEFDCLECVQEDGEWGGVDLRIWMLDADWRPVGEEKEERVPGPKQARELNAAEMDEIICAAREIEFPWDWSRHEFPWGSGTRNATRLAIMKHLGQLEAKPKEEPSEALRYWAGRFPIKEEPKGVDAKAMALWLYRNLCESGQRNPLSLFTDEVQGWIREEYGLKEEPKACEHPRAEVLGSRSWADGVVQVLCPDCKTEFDGNYQPDGVEFRTFNEDGTRTRIPHLDFKMGKCEHCGASYGGDSCPACFSQKTTNWTITPSPLSAGDKPVAKGFAPEPTIRVKNARTGAEGHIPESAILWTSYGYPICNKLRNPFPGGKYAALGRDINEEWQAGDYLNPPDADPIARTLRPGRHSRGGEA